MSPAAGSTLQEPHVRPGRGGPMTPPGHGDDSYPGGWSGGGSASAPPADTATIGVWLLVAAVVILFASFTSTLVVRRAESDWRPGPMPAILWVNTAALLASSVTLEWARAGGRGGRRADLRLGLAATGGLGGAFLVGQLAAWRQLLASGIALATGPSSAFFYLLTGAHGLHLVGGLGALLYGSWRVRRFSPADQVPPVLAPLAIYWHFVGVLWLYVFVLLSLS